MIEKIRAMGVSRALHLFKVRAEKKLLHIFYTPAWWLFRLKHLNLLYAFAVSPNTDQRLLKEARIQEILSRISNGRFLEIGIGEFPHFDRLELINKKSISYVGCDFADVCNSHEEELAIKNIILRNASFAKNQSGTYAWTLFEMVQRGEQYDSIFIDGHHTFYIDFPAILLADRLLKPGGYLIVDDIPWTLSFLKTNMVRSLSQWYFYRSMYDFKQYTPEQQSIPHIQMIVEETLLKPREYVKDEKLSLQNLWILRKIGDIKATE